MTFHWQIFAFLITYIVTPCSEQNSFRKLALSLAAGSTCIEVKCKNLNKTVSMFPTRFGLTVGSVEFEKVIKCFEIENDVLFERKRRDVGVQDCAVKHNEENLQEENLSCGVKQDSEAIVDGLEAIKGLSLQNNKASLAMKKKGKESLANPSRKVRSNSTPNISNEKLKGLWVKKKAEEIRRNSDGIFSKRQPEGEEALSYHKYEKPGETNRVLARGGNRALRNRRASLPSCGSVAFPQSPAERMKNKDYSAHADMSKKKILKGCISGPETGNLSLNETPSPGNRMRRFSLPAFKTLEKFPRISRNMRNGKANDINLGPDLPDDLGKDVSLEHVFRLWNVRLPKDLANDLKRTLAYK